MNGAVKDIDVLVIGAGLFGSVIGEALARTGRTISYVDARRPTAGSLAAGCLMKPAWLSLGADEYNRCLRRLDTLYGAERVTLVTKPLNRKLELDWVAPEKILRYPQAVDGVITKVAYEGPRLAAQLQMHDKTQYTVHPTLIIVACGIWTSKLFPVEGLYGKAGLSCAFPGSIFENKINVWAPYKQLIAFNNWKPGMTWVGDGSAILEKNWDEAKRKAVVERCAKFVDKHPSDAQVVSGVRPIVKGLKEPAYLKEVEKNVWVATGGGKNGLLGAAWCAEQVVAASY